MQAADAKSFESTTQSIPSRLANSLDGSGQHAASAQGEGKPQKERQSLPS